MNVMNKKSFYKQLWFWVVVFMILGIVFGIYAPNLAKQTKPGIDLFIHAIKILVGPIIFLTVVSGVLGIGNLKQLGSIGIKALVYFEVVSTIALIIGLAFGYLFHPGVGLNLTIASMDASVVKQYMGSASQGTDFVSILLSAIPRDPLSPFITGNTLQVLVLAIICGLALFYLSGNRQARIAESVYKLQGYAFRILSVVMYISPFAAFSAMAFMLGQFGIEVIWHMLALVATMISACLFFIFVVLGILARLAGFGILEFLRLIKEEIILVFATSSSESALGPIMQKLRRSGVHDSVVGLVIPAGFSFNLDGTNIYLALVIAFLCQAFNIHMSLGEYLSIILILMLTSKGAAGVSGAGFVVLAGTLAAMDGKIPVVTIAILLGIDKIMSELRSTTNLIGNSIAAVMVAKWENKLDQEKFARELSGS